jgi:hypothetical protein
MLKLLACMGEFVGACIAVNRRHELNVPSSSFERGLHGAASCSPRGCAVQREEKHWHTIEEGMVVHASHYK